MSRMKRKIVRDGMLGRKTLLLAVAAMAAALASLASLAGPAQAYDSRTCFALVTEPVADIDQFKMNSGSVDFGDSWHLGGSPLGDAVVCWGDGGQIVIRGNLYADSPTPITAAIDVRYFHTDGTFGTTQRQRFLGQNGENRSIQYNLDSGTGTSTVDRVRIRLWRCLPSPSGGDCNLVNAETFHRGDVNIE
jgi:hypothetical protein